MSYRTVCSFVAAAGLMVAASHASAQQMSEGYTFLDAVKKSDGTKVTDILNEPGSRIIDTRDASTGETALHIVARRSDAVYLRFLLQRGANPNATDRAGNSPMIVAVNNDFEEGIQILLTYKANVNLRNAQGETPLIRAVQIRNLEMVQTLLAGGADPDQADVIAGMSARDYAARDTRSPAIRKALADATKTGAKTAAGPKL